jgi:L-fuconolactonase
MTGPAAALHRPFGLADLRDVAVPAGVSATVVVQAASNVGETEDLLALAAASGDLLRGVVGWADLTAPDLPDVIDRLAGCLGGDRLVGIRHQVHDEPDPAWLERADVVRGLRTLADRDLAYDLLVRTRELPAATRVSAAVDNLRFVLDHGGKPPIAVGELEPWSSRLAELAALPNVTCKVSGLVTEANWNTWTPTGLAPYVDRLIELFAPQRLMFGSDWPVCTLAAGYADVADATRQCLSGLSAAEMTAIFSGTATTTYGLSAAG